MVFYYRNSQNNNCLVPEWVLLSANGGMRNHSCIAQVNFEREHGIFFNYIMIMSWHHVSNSFPFSLCCNYIKLFIIKMSSIKYKELSILSLVSWADMCFINSSIISLKFSILFLSTFEFSKLSSFEYPWVFLELSKFEKRHVIFSRSFVDTCKSSSYLWWASFIPVDLIFFKFSLDVVGLVPTFI